MHKCIDQNRRQSLLPLILRSSARGYVAGRSREWIAKSFNGCYIFPDCIDEVLPQYEILFSTTRDLFLLTSATVAVDGEKAFFPPLSEPLALGRGLGPHFLRPEGSEGTPQQPDGETLMWAEFHGLLSRARDKPYKRVGGRLADRQRGQPPKAAEFWVAPKLIGTFSSSEFSYFRNSNSKSSNF